MIPFGTACGSSDEHEGLGRVRFGHTVVMVPGDRSDELETLVMQGDLDKVLQSVSVEDIAEVWCRYTAQPSSEHADDDPDWWAVSFAMAAGYEQHPVVRPLLLALIDAAPNDQVVGDIGAGPLENFISDEESDLAWLETHAASRPKLAAAVAGAWVAGTVSETTLSRLERIAGAPLDRPRPREEWSAELVELDDATRDAARLIDPEEPLDAASLAALQRFLVATRPPGATEADEPKNG